MKDHVYQRVEALSATIIDLANDLWEHPEPSLEEHRSADQIMELLRQHGFEVSSGVGGLPTAFVGVAGSGSPAIGILGEYDALPSLSQARQADETPVTPGAPGHGCGHNLFAAGSLAGALAIQQTIDAEDLDGRVVYFGCPAEEVAIGKVYMAHAGAFDDIDAVLSWHPGDLTEPNRGSCLAMNSVRYAFKGRSAHAAANPEGGRSALDAAQLMNMGVEYLREHVPDAVRLHYAIETDGGTPNVVPAEATVWYYVRAPSREAVESVTERVDDIAEGAALMTGTTLDVNLVSGTYETLPNAELTDLIEQNLHDAGEIDYTAEDRSFADELAETLASNRRRRLDDLQEPLRERVADESIYAAPVPATDADGVGPYSTDTGNVSWLAPLGRFRAATWPVGTAPHTWQAVAASGTFGPKAAVYAGKVLAGAAHELLTEPALLAAAKAEFDDATADVSYTSPLDDPPTPPADLSG